MNLHGPIVVIMYIGAHGVKVKLFRFFFALCAYGMFVGLAYQCKDIVFQFVIEYTSLRVFGP